MKRLIFLLAIGVCACVPAQEAGPAGYRRYNLGGYTVAEFRLADGTRCVAPYSGGIDCDWEGR